MKKKIAATTLSAAVLTTFALLGTSAQAGISGFGTIPGNPAGAYGGSGIPTAPSAFVQGSIGAGDTLTMALSTTAYRSTSPTPTTTTDYIFNVDTGHNSEKPLRSLWNYDFYLNSSAGNLGLYTFTLTVLNVGNGHTVSYNPFTDIGDNEPMHSLATAGNSESLDFIASLIGYDANANDTYDFTLTATDGTTTLSTSEQVIAGTGAVSPVPEPTTVVAGSLLLLPFGISALRKFRKSAASVA